VRPVTASCDDHGVECPDCEDVVLMADLPGRHLCPACGRGWRVDSGSGRLVEDEGSGERRDF
jgi:hypothetical protein